MRFCLIGLLFFCTLWVSAQAKFEAVVDSKEVPVDGFVRVSFVLSDPNGKKFQAPKFENLQLIQGPSQSSSTSIINGKISGSLSFAYIFKPKKIGTVTIGPASIEWNGKKLNSSPIQIKVINAKPKSGPDAIPEDEQYFVKVELDTNIAHVGEQIILNYKLYTTKNIETVNVVSESKYEAFYTEQLPRLNYNMQREYLDGVEYATKIIRSVALFPQQTGTYEIEPMAVRIGISVNDPKARSLFFSSRTVRKMISSNAVSLKVVPMPKDESGLWNGSVGTFTMQSSLDLNNINTDQVATLKLKIEGDGDFRRINAPKILGGEKFEIYDPNLVYEDKDNMKGAISNYKVYDYILVPKEIGISSVIPQVTFFSPDSNRYITLKDTLQISITKGKRPLGGKEIVKVEKEIKELQPILIDLKLKTKGRGLYGTSLFWILSCCPFLLLGAVVLYKQKLNKEASISDSDRKKANALRMAKSHLEKAKGHLDQKESKAFYKEISIAILGYIADKFKLSQSEMSKQKVAELLRDKNVDSSLIDQFHSILQESEQALYAFSSGSSAMDQTYERTLEWISAVENETGS